MLFGSDKMMIDGVSQAERSGSRGRLDVRIMSTR